MLENEKQTYYISLGGGEIYSTPNAGPWQFRIRATEKEIKQLRKIFEAQSENQIGDYIRSHTPYVPYHHDPTNDFHDLKLIEAYRVIYQLGDQEAKDHIKSMGILDDFTSV